MNKQDNTVNSLARIKAGDKKFKHVHIVIEVPRKVSVSTIARWFNVPPQQVEILHGRGAFLDGVEYLLLSIPLLEL